MFDANHQSEANRSTSAKCGENRVWINPLYVDQVASAVQTDDIREFIDEGWIRAKPVKGTSVSCSCPFAQKRKGRRKGQGTRAGTANARNPRKNRWMRTIRSQRRGLKELREDKTSSRPSQYRRYYLRPRAAYRSIAHMRSQMALEGVEFKEAMSDGRQQPTFHFPPTKGRFDRLPSPPEVAPWAEGSVPLSVSNTRTTCQLVRGLPMATSCPFR